MHQSDRPVTGVLAFILINPLTDSKHWPELCEWRFVVHNQHIQQNIFVTLMLNLETYTLFYAGVVSYYRAFSVVLTCKEIRVTLYHNWMTTNFIECWKVSKWKRN